MYLLVKDRIVDLNLDPLQRGAQHYEVNSCSCFTDNGQLYFNQTSTWIVRQPIQEPEIDYENIFEDILND